MATKRCTAMLLAFVLMGLVACRPRTQEGSAPKAQQFARRILGTGAAFKAAEVKADEVNASMAKRRAEAWRIVEETMKPVSIDLGEFGTRRLAAWQTWYDRTEFRRLFEILYRCELTNEERDRFKDPTSSLIVADERVEKVIRDFPRQDLGTAWTEGRFRELLSQLKTANDLAGLNGVDGTGMSLYSPALIGHYLKNAAAVYNCDSPIPPAPGSDDVIGDCFGKPFPPAAVAVKPTFNRVQSGAMAFDTSASGLERMFQASGDGQDMWRTAAAVDEPVVSLEGDGGSRIYKVNYRQGDTLGGEFALTGMHITTKEIPEWMWVSLWWSKQPDRDFGADRPKDLAEKIDPVYANYKMCVASTFEEQDPVITGAAVSKGDLPADLLASLRASYKFLKPATWCSNPYIEHMPHGALTNCIGCHQHSGPNGIAMPTPQRPSDVLKVGRHFPGDFMASFHGGKDDFQGLIQEIVSTADLEGLDLDRSLCLASAIVK